ncbi:hypothetical protein [Streptomyces sp. Tu 2975]|uniref:hypothetical protein n=1 Tax=Streptomyces sp. Tu 2975 TaxID=2676871 RepID=UPI001ABE17D5|nr:hypothetical protein [Streptomyces sp. Tu 2975]
MTVHQLPAEIGTFARYLGELVERLDPAGGWYAIFLRRDPEGMRACLDGSEIPPWDVVESLLYDLPAQHAAESARAAGLHAAAAAAHDRLPGGHERLEERVEFMRRERLRAQGRAEELLRLLPGCGQGSAEAERLTHELAWTRDDHTRAVRRLAELDSRLADFVPRGNGSAYDPARRPAASADAGTRSGEPQPPEAPQGDGKRRGAGKKRRARGGARFAGMEDAGDDAVAVPLLPVAGDVPRGARYGGAAAEAVPEAPPVPEGAYLAARDTVAALGRLRAEGRGGEAHALICEAAARPAAWLPALADELNRSGPAADWATLLWEVASQPALRLAAAAEALVAAGRGDDGGQLLRQGVFRSADEIADAVLTLEEAGTPHRARTLLAAFVQVRTAADAAACATRDPGRLVPMLLDAARGVSPARERDVVHALRVAGHLRG